MVAAYPDDQFVCFADRWTRDSFDLDAGNVRVVCVRQSSAPSQAAAAKGYRSPVDMIRLTRATWREPLDVFFSPSVYTYFPLPQRLPAVVTIHDAIAEKFPELTLPTARARIFWHAKVRLAIWQARLILTVSDYAARELTANLKIPPARIRVTSEAPARSYRPSDSADEVLAAAARIGIPAGARWLIYVGWFNPHKHVDVIVRAHASVARRPGVPPLYLVLVGAPDRDVFHGNLGQIRAAIAEAGTEDLVIWTGFVPDEAVRHLHSGAVALLLPSACEGFGLPAVEAAPCGTPVIATIESPLPELLAGGGIFVPPGDQAAVCDALRSLLTDEPGRRRMGERARQRAAGLSWTVSARTAMRTLREAAS